MTAVRRLKDKLYDLACVEITANELWVGLMLLEGHNGEMVGFHDGMTYCGNAFEEVLSIRRGGARQWFDEYYLRRRLGSRSIDTLDSDGHHRVTASIPERYEVLVVNKGVVTVEAGRHLTLAREST